MFLLLCVPGFICAVSGSGILTAPCNILMSAGELHSSPGYFLI